MGYGDGIWHAGIVYHKTVHKHHINSIKLSKAFL